MRRRFYYISLRPWVLLRNSSLLLLNIHSIDIFCSIFWLSIHIFCSSSGCIEYRAISNIFIGVVSSILLRHSINIHFRRLLSYISSRLLLIRNISSRLLLIRNITIWLLINISSLLSRIIIIVLSSRLLLLYINSLFLYLLRSLLLSVWLTIDLMVLITEEIVLYHIRIIIRRSIYNNRSIQLGNLLINIWLSIDLHFITSKVIIGLHPSKVPIFVLIHNWLFFLLVLIRISMNIYLIWIIQKFLHFFIRRHRIFETSKVWSLLLISITHRRDSSG